MKGYLSEKYSKWGQHIHSFDIFSEKNKRKLLLIMSFSVVIQSLSDDSDFQITYVKENKGGKLLQLSPEKYNIVLFCADNLHQVLVDFTPKKTIII